MDKTTPDDLTAKDLAELPSGMGERYELIEGELIVMAPAGVEHGKIAGNIFGEIYIYLKSHPIGIGLTAETGFYTRGNERTVRAPDYAFIRNENIPEEGLPKGYGNFIPDLVVEVVSPNDKANEVEDKIQEWLDFGVRLVWVIYPQQGRIHVHRQGNSQVEILTREDTLSGEDVLPDFAVSIREIV